MRIALLLSQCSAQGLALARAWRAAGDQVDVVLLDAAVSAARRGHAHTGALREALDAGVAVAAHEEALRRRSIGHAGLLDGVKTVNLDEVADLVAEGADKAVWL